MMDKNIAVWLSEFEALRDEIGNRGRVQQVLMVLNMTALSTIIGIAFASPAWWVSYLWLIIPLLSSILSFLFLNHDFTVAIIGQYIRDRIRPKLCELTGDAQIMGWESWAREIPTKSKIPQQLTFHIAAPTLFILPSIITLFITFRTVFPSDGWIISAWLLGAGFTLLNIYFWSYRYSYWLGKNP